MFDPKLAFQSSFKRFSRLRFFFIYLKTKVYYAVRCRNAREETARKFRTYLPRAYFCIIVCAVFSGANAQFKPSPMKFDFGSGAVAKGYTPVTANDFYSREKNFGFEPGGNINCVDRSGKNALRSDFCTSD
jgi:hypothetical protein